MKEEHWRIIIADTECPFREKLDNLGGSIVYFCSKKKDPEDNLYCSFSNCLKREV